MKRWSQLAPIAALVGALSWLSACGGGGGGDVAPPPTVPQPVFVDTDKDGIADAEDAAPGDSLCAAASDASQGVCHLRALAAPNGLLKLVGNDNGKLFFRVFAAGNVPMLYSYDLATRHFLGRVAILGFMPSAYAYSADHGRLYVADTSGAIRAYSEALVAQPTEFARVEEAGSPIPPGNETVVDQMALHRLTAAGRYLVVQARLAGELKSRHYVFDKQGLETARAERSGFSFELDWSTADNRLYYFSSYEYSDGGKLVFTVIDQASGRISGEGSSTDHLGQRLGGEIRAGVLHGKVLLGSGDLFLAQQLTWAGELPVEINDAMALEGNEVLTQLTKEPRKLIRYGADLRKLEEVSLDGRLVGMVQQAGKYYLIVETIERVEIRSYVPS